MSFALCLDIEQLIVLHHRKAKFVIEIIFFLLNKAPGFNNEK